MRFSFLFIIILVFATYYYVPNLHAQETPILKIIKPVYFDLPIDCDVGTDCWVMNYVDFDPDDETQTDPACLARTYDGHKGTDFALLDGVALAQGVDVLAAADGTVSRLRDSEKDAWHTPDELDAIRENQKECGNGIFIDHGNNISTVYCHLRQGSVVVKRGQEVKRGDKIAQVGLSGMTEFPHLHFGIINKGKVMDPFTGQDNEGDCDKEGRPLWHEDVSIEYHPLIIQAVGFHDDVPSLEAIERKAEAPSKILIESGVMTFWVTILGAREGDDIIMQIKDPNGKEFAIRNITQEKNRARQFYYVGKRLNKETALEGAYTASVKIKRPDERDDENKKNKTWHKTSAVLLTQ